MSKTTKKAEVAVVATSDVVTNIEIIDRELSQLQKINETVYKTGGNKSFPGFNESINQMRSVEDIIKLVSSVNQREKAYNEAAIELGLGNYPVAKFEGCTAKEWIEDAKLRLQILQYESRYKELQSMKKEWEELMDKEDRKAKLMQKMQKSGITPKQLEG